MVITDTVRVRASTSGNASARVSVGVRANASFNSGGQCQCQCQSSPILVALQTFSLLALPPSRSGLHTVMAAWLSTLWQAVQCEGLVLVYMCGGYEYVTMTEYVRAYACVAICVKCK